MRVEKVLAIAVLVGIFLKFMRWPGSGIVLIISLSTLAMLYCPGSFYFFSDKKIKRSNLPLSVISGFFLSIIPIAILFKLQFWPGAMFYLTVGTISALAIFGVVLFLRFTAGDDLKTYYKNMTIRTGALLAVSALVYFTSNATLLAIQYRDDPEMARLKTLHYSNPENEEYRRQHDAYVKKQDSLFFQKGQADENY